jgi:hypothetical protein
MPPPLYSVVVGESVTLRAYLLETTTIELATDGLLGAGVALSTTDATVGWLSGVSAITFNSAFVNLIPAPTVEASMAGFTGDIDFDPPIFSDGGRIYLGSFTITGLSAGTTLLALHDRIFDASETVTDNLRALDDEIDQGSARLEVLTAVPEPSSVVLTLTGTVVLCTFRSFRKKSKH